jgi:hypothetical protein
LKIGYSKIKIKNFPKILLKIGYSNFKIKIFPKILFTASCPLYSTATGGYIRGVTGEGVRRGVYMGGGVM